MYSFLKSQILATLFCNGSMCSQLLTNKRRLSEIAVNQLNVQPCSVVSCVVQYTAIKQEFMKTTFTPYNNKDSAKLMKIFSERWHQCKNTISGAHDPIFQATFCPMFSSCSTFGWTTTPYPLPWASNFKSFGYR